MAYLSLIHGADGIGYYSYNNVTGKKDTNIAKEQPALWQEVKHINSEIVEMRPFLLEQHKVPVVLQEGAPEVEFLALGRAGGTLLLLANTASAAKTAVLRFPPHAATKGNRSLKALRGGKTIFFEGARVKVSLEPCEALGLIE
jgi:hypothetical protein